MLCAFLWRPAVQTGDKAWALFPDEDVTNDRNGSGLDVFMQNQDQDRA